MDELNQSDTNGKSDFIENDEQTANNLFKTEEEYHMNRGRLNVDPTTTRPPMRKTGNYKT